MPAWVRLATISGASVRYALPIALGGVILTWCLLYLLIDGGVPFTSASQFQFDKSINLAAFITIPGIFFAVISLLMSVFLQRGAFVKDYMAQFFLRPELYQTWHDLIYDYDDDLFEYVDRFVSDEKLTQRTRRPIPLALNVNALKEDQRDKWSDIKIYHPAIFQGSEEEKRIDSLFGYLNVIGYYHARGLIHLRDISGTLGYFLAHMSQRKVVRAYVRIMNEAWERRGSRLREIHPVPPYSYLEHLLSAIERRNASLQRRIASSIEAHRRGES